jgi:hypothetical protein
MLDLDYPVIMPLSAGDDGGFIATVPDLPGCMSDGETAEARSPTCATRSRPDRAARSSGGAALAAVSSGIRLMQLRKLFQSPRYRRPAAFC